MMADNTAFFYRGLAAYLRERTGVDIHVLEDPPWQERQRQLEEGAAHVGFLCGLTYVRWADRGAPDVELLAAPVPRGERYGGRPVYFSDVVVRRDSAFRTFADLAGARWAYNEPGSHSGYNVVRAHLADLGAPEGYFGSAVEAGSHQRALQLLLNGTVDGAAIDTTVLELEQHRRPDVADHLRIVATLGPSAIPPGVISLSAPAPIRHALRQALLAMADDPAAPLLHAAGLSRFAPVTDSDYDPIRRMDRRAAPVRLAPSPTRDSPVRSQSPRPTMQNARRLLSEPRRA